MYMYHALDKKEGRDHLGDLHIVGMIILKWILKRV
jgi:hypothetical protein